MSKFVLFYDFETLSQDPETAPIVSLASIIVTMENIESNKYSYEELLSETKFIKFDVKDQVVNWKRVIDPKTIEWWEQQEPAARATLKPTANDKPITDMITFLKDQIADKNIEYVFTRNNTFDPVIVQSIVRATGETIPYPWWTIRDVKSFIFGLTYGHNIKDSFIPPLAEGKYVKHDPRHDIVLDVLRLQTVIHAKFGD